MTLPISFPRPAQESPPSAPAHDAAYDPASPARTFGHALSSAMHGPSTRDDVASRRARAERQDASRDTRVRDTSNRDAWARDAAPRDEMTHEMSGGDAASREASRRDPSDRADSVRDDSARAASTRDASTRDASVRSTRSAQLDRTAQRDDRSADEPRDGARASLGREPGTTFVGTPSARANSSDTASADPASSAQKSGEQDGVGTDESQDAVTAGAAFVAHTLESAVAALPPLGVIAGGLTIGTTGTTGTGGEAAAEGEGASSAATTATPAMPALTLSIDRAVDEATRAARRLALEGAAARDPLGVRRDLDALAPELRARLDRVVDRMEQEYGYTVEVVETTRSQERQNALYAQGRTAPGDVVTWTRNSKHLTGSAADVVIDGGYSNPAGFERLARVAREEGLRTLWPRDPGHIELAGVATRGTNEATTPESAPRLVRGHDGDVHILPVGVDAAIAPAIPQATRSGIDPSATRGLRGRLPGSENGVHIMPTAPTDGKAQILPFPGLDALQEAAGDTARASIGNASFGSASLAGVALGRAALGRELAGSAVGASASPSAATGALKSPAPQQAPAIAGVAGVGGVAGVASVATVAQVAAVAPVASVASVATVATVATVASVASVARVGGTTRADEGAPHEGNAAPPAGSPNATPHSQLAPAAVIAGDGDARRGAGSERRPSSERGERERADGMIVATPSNAESESARALLGREGGTTERSERGASTAPVAGLTRSDATERIARVLRIQEAASERPMSSVLLRLDTPDGGEDRIRIDLRGHSVGATLDIADPQVAAELRARAPELQQALQRQGLEGESMVVRTSSRSSDASVLTASAIATERDVARAASATASDGGGSTAKDSRNPPRAFERDGTDQQRSRQRRDGKGDRR